MAFAMERVGAVREPAAGLAGWRMTVTRWAMHALIWMVIIGLSPMTERQLTIPATGEGDASRQAVYILICLAVAVATSWTSARRAIAVPPLLLLTLFWCGISIGWSVAPGVAVRRLVLTTLIIWTVFRIVEDLGYEEAITAVRRILIVTLVLNFVAIVVNPSAAIHHNNELTDTSLVGSWRGVLAHKNWAGAVCALTIIMFVFDARRWNVWLRLGVILATAIFLYKTQSKTSEGILLFSLAVGLVFTRYNPVFRMLLVPCIALVLAGVFAFAMMRWSEIVLYVSDPMSFTGRGAIWQVLVRYFLDHPLLGAGYNSFWNVGPASPAFSYAPVYLQFVGNGHNGYLDFLITAGVPGLVLALLALFIVPIGRILIGLSVPRQSGAMVLAIILFCGGHNLTETSLLDRDMTVQVFLMLGVALAYALPFGAAAAPETGMGPVLPAPALLPAKAGRWRMAARS